MGVRVVMRGGVVVLNVTYLVCFERAAVGALGQKKVKLAKLVWWVQSS